MSVKTMEMSLLSLKSQSDPGQNSPKQQQFPRDSALELSFLCIFLGQW